MKIRIRMLITAALACHLVVAPRLVTSQLQPKTPPFNTSPATFKPPTPGEEVTIRSREQEKSGDVYHLRGDVEIEFRSLVFRGEEVTYHADTGDVSGKGHVVLDGGPHDEHIEADHGTYNVNSGNGRLYQVRGTTGARMSGRNVMLTSSNPFFFSGDEVEIEGRGKITVHHGTITSCQMPKPKWQFRTSTAVVVAGKDAKVYNTTFHLWSVPVFYFPFVQYPVERLRRKSGFLIPSLGQSSKKGFIIGDSLYWAINRSFDTTLGVEYFSHRGWAEHVTVRGAPSENSYLNFSAYSMQDRGIGTPRQDQGGTEAHLSAGSPMPLGFRGVVNLNYLSSLIFRLGFAESFQQAINSEVESTAFLSQTRRGFSINLMGSRYQNFWSATPGDVITVLHTPSFESSSVERPIGNSRLMWSYDAALEGISRREPSFSTSNLMVRADIRPSLSIPWVWHGWGLRPGIAVRDTYYSERLVPGVSQLGSAIPQAINRRAVETAFEVRPPAVSRIFKRTISGHQIKHTIEPHVTYRYVTGVDNFASTIRFDARDVLSDTNEIEYGLVNRLYAKRAPGTNCTPPTPANRIATQSHLPGLVEPASEESFGQDPTYTRAVISAEKAQPTAEQAIATVDECETPSAHEIISWEVAQKHFFDPSFGGALINGRRNVFTSSVDFTGIAFITDPRAFSPIISRLRVRGSNRADVEWHFDYDPKKGRISASTTFVNYRFRREISFAAGHAFLQSPGEVNTSTPLPSVSRFNQFRLVLQYGTPWKRGFNFAAATGYDTNINFLQYAAFQTNYNWDCCGISFEYRRFALGAVRNENQFRFALSLTNLGTFGTLRRQERLF